MSSTTRAVRRAPNQRPARRPKAKAKPRAKVEGAQAVRRDAYAVWEVTLKCNLACQHCGSRAGTARHSELSTEEAFDLVRQLAEVGINEVTLIGGEAFLRPDWLELISAIQRAGMTPTMATGGFGISLSTAQKMKDAGLAQVSVSVDGLEESHDRLRGRPGSFQQCFEAMRHFAQVGLPFAINTQVNRHSAPVLPELYERLRDAGARGWQYTLTVPMGNAAEFPEHIIQPCELLELYPVLARVTNRALSEGMVVMPGNDIGYFGPYEELLRHSHAELGWQGCCAGSAGIGIEANGNIKGCSSLPSQAYVGGNVREQPLKEILNSRPLTLNLNGGTSEGTAHLWGHCKTCEWAALCRGGCMWTAHVFFDRPGNNPHCHSRALRLEEQGLRERVRQKTKAGGQSFDHGVFELIEEPLDAPWPAGDPLRFTRDKVTWPKGWETWPWL
jgi:radical SAM protein with 4Fe4S-binding SPASM domain